MATQISQVLAKFLEKLTVFKQVLLVGGSTVKDDVERLRKGCNIIIATPGRLEDILTNCKEINLVGAVKSLVMIFFIRNILIHYFSAILYAKMPS